jgi:hypothetical protein
LRLRLGAGSLIEINPTGAGLSPAPPLEENMEMANGSGNGSEATPVANQGAKPGAQKSVRAPKPAKRQKELSSIGFPYMSLDTGIAVARAVLNAGGVPLSREQLAGVMGSSSGSGTFLIKIATARIFGLINYAQGKYELTNLGFSIVDSDEKRQRTAFAESFLIVPLYRRVYEEFKGKQLPPRPHGLVQAFVKFGVAPKQANYARLAFDKSAMQAGFFAAGPDRLIEPIIGSGKVGLTGTSSAMATGRAGLQADRNWPTAEENNSDGENGRGAVESSAPETRRLHPFIQGLLDSLPGPDTNWTVDGRAKWLQAAANIFDLMYKGSGEIHITVKGEQKLQE